MFSLPWVIAAIGVVGGILLKVGFDFFLGSPRWRAENSSTGLAIQLEQVRRDAAARAESDVVRINRLEDEAVQLKSQLNDKTAVTEISSLKAAVSQSEETLKQYKFDSAKELNKATGELERISHERIKLEQQLADLEQKMLRNQEAESKLIEREATNKTLQVALDKNKQELAGSQKSLLDLQEELEKLEAVKSERNEFAVQVENQQTTINALNEQYQAEITLLEKQKSDVAQELELAQTSANDEKQSLIAQLTSLRDEWTEKEQALVEEVSEIAAVHQSKVNELESENALLVKTRAELSQEVARLAQRLSAAQPIRTDGPTLDGEAVASNGERPKIYLKAATRRDPLYQINGIGPVHEQKLFSAGITKFSELAVLSDDRIRDIIGAEAWQNGEGSAWASEAAKRIAGII